jgi:hypothetical protein
VCGMDGRASNELSCETPASAKGALDLGVGVVVIRSPHLLTGVAGHSSALQKVLI